MARKKINYYKFTPGVTGVGTVQIPDQLSLDDILMITNVTRNTVIYNFGDPNRGAYNAASGGTGAVISTDGADTNTTFSSVTGYASAFYNGVTTLYLRFDTSTHSANDVLQIYVESEELKIRTHDFGIDAVERQRVGIPRSMIDADFEYGLQSTKWSGFSTYRQTPTTYEMSGTDFSVNAYSYVTMISGEHPASATIAPANTTRHYEIVNQGNVYLVGTPAQSSFANVTANSALSNFGSVIVNMAPQHYLNDYKLIINQPTGTTGPGVSTFITSQRPITPANSGPFQRTFTVHSTAELRVNDVIAAVGLPSFGASTSTSVIGTVASLGTGSVVANVAQTIQANTIIAFEIGAAGSDVFELMHVPVLVSASTTISGARQLLGTGIWAANRANITPVAGGRIYSLQAGAAAGASAAQSTSMEFMRVDAVNYITNEVTVTRGWMGTNANATFGQGTVISHVNVRPGQTYTQWLANTEIIKMTASTVDNSTFAAASLGNISYQPSWVTTRGAYLFADSSGQLPLQRVGAAGAQPVQIQGTANYLTGELPIVGYGVPGMSYAGGIRPGSFMVTLSGMFVAGNTSVPLTMINANNHSIARFTTSNIGNAWVSTIATTGSFQNANVEGIFMNHITDQNYVAFFPKNADASRHPGAPLIPPSEVQVISPRFKKGAIYQGANLLINQANVQITSNVAAGTPAVANIIIRTQNPHGVLPGTPIQVALASTASVTADSAAKTIGSGIFVVNFANLYYFGYNTKAVTSNPFPAVAMGTAITANVVPFPTSQVKHRGLDGGTNIGINAPSWGMEATRQTRKYFRYQSGKGMMFTTGTQFNPVFSVANISANSATLTTASGVGIDISTTVEHGLQRGANVKIYGLNTVGYNNFYNVDRVQGPYVFTVKAKTDLGARYPTVLGANVADQQYNARVAVTNWSGAKVRSGMFDDANGIFWEYDGQYLWAVKRSATYDLPGSVAISAGDNRVDGDGNTRFLDNVKAGDLIQIRGMVHDVISIESNSVLYITPSFRSSVNATAASYSIIKEVRVRSALFNMDKLDGTGPSGYTIDLSKMQMVGIQYTWYGAGFIDWGMRTTDGRMIWAHRVKNNNRNDEGYMRSGNLPARYQSVNRGALTVLTLAVSSSDTTFRVANIDEFPTSVSATYPAYALVENEIISFTGVTNLGIAGSTPQGTLTGVTRAAEYNPVILNEQRSLRGDTAVAHLANTSPVMLYGITASPDLNHWGSAVILDGDFDVDRTYSFTYSVNNYTISAAVGTPQTIFMIRLAPSLGSGIGGDLGQRDLLNRAQLLLQNCYINVSGASARALLQGIVNPINVAAANWQNVNTQLVSYSPSFAQFVANTALVGNPSNSANGGVNTHMTQIQWTSYHTPPTGQIGANVAGITLSGVTVVPYAFGGEQLFSIPVTQTNSGFLDLTKVKEVGGTIVPGNQVYPNGPEIIAFNWIPISTSNYQIDVQVTWIESQA